VADTRTTISRAAIELIDGPLPDAPTACVEGAGAVLVFFGAVRPHEEGRPLLGLDYTSYDPMAENQLRRLAVQAIQTHGLLQVRIVHSRGFVAAGEVSLRLTVASAHRKAALLAMDEILDDLKRDVPIWKFPVFAEEQG